MKRRGNELGLALLNLALVLGLLFGTQALIRGRMRDTEGLVILSAVVFAAYLAGTRWIEGHSPPELVGKGRVTEFAAGLGIALFSSVMGLLWIVGYYHLVGYGSASDLATGVLIALMVGISEETLVRGFVFRIVEMAGGTWIGVFVSSALFGSAHAFNPGATVLSSIAIALEAGVLLAAAYVLTRSRGVRRRVDLPGGPVRNRQGENQVPVVHPCFTLIDLSSQFSKRVMA